MGCGSSVNTSSTVVASNANGNDQPFQGKLAFDTPSSQPAQTFQPQTQAPVQNHNGSTNERDFSNFKLASEVQFQTQAQPTEVQVNIERKVEQKPPQTVQPQPQVQQFPPQQAQPTQQFQQQQQHPQPSQFGQPTQQHQQVQPQFAQQTQPQSQFNQQNQQPQFQQNQHTQQNQFGQPVQQNQNQFGQVQPTQQNQHVQQNQFGQPTQQNQFGQPVQQNQNQFGQVQPTQQNQFGQPVQQNQHIQQNQNQFGQPVPQQNQHTQQNQFGQPTQQNQFGQPTNQQQNQQFQQHPGQQVQQPQFGQPHPQQVNFDVRAPNQHVMTKPVQPVEIIPPKDEAEQVRETVHGVTYSIGVISKVLKSVSIDSTVAQAHIPDIEAKIRKENKWLKAISITFNLNEPNLVDYFITDVFKTSAYTSISVVFEHFLMFTPQALQNFGKVLLNTPLEKLSLTHNGYDANDTSLAIVMPAVQRVNQSLKVLRLNFISCIEMTDQAFIYIKDAIESNQVLENVALSFGNTTNITMQSLVYLQSALRHKPNLTKLELSFMNMEHFNDGAFPIFTEIVRALPKLEYLDISTLNAGYSQEGFSSFAAFVKTLKLIKLTLFWKDEPNAKADS